MTGTARLSLALGGLVAVAGLAWAAARTDAPAAVQGTVAPAACSSCDARHANLRERRALLSEGRE